MSKPESERGVAEQPASPTEAVPEGRSVLDRMLGSREDDRSLTEGEVATWSEAAGVLVDGRSARLGASCLLLPEPGDRVLLWRGETGDRCVLAVLERPGSAPAAVLAAPGPLAIRAPRLTFGAQAVHLQADDFITSTRNRHAVEHVRTETVHTRVAQVGTDIRRAEHATDEVNGTVLQRAGTWISNTLHEARLHARAFLFD